MFFSGDTCTDLCSCITILALLLRSFILSLSSLPGLDRCGCSHVREAYSVIGFYFSGYLVGSTTANDRPESLVSEMSYCMWSGTSGSLTPSAI